MKPSDCFAIPLCGFHHNIQHIMGETSFEKTYEIDMKAVAAELWKRSPHNKGFSR